MIDTLWLATDNAKKRAELERLLGPLGVTLRPLADLPAPVEIVEDAPDFAGNAAIKSRIVAGAAGAAALGDDSGLCVDALDGAPGVRSARWAGPTDADRIAHLLAELARVGADAPHDRRAHFACVLCLTTPRAGDRLFEGRCPGYVLDAPRGSGGFGYDPVFVPEAALPAAVRGAAPDPTALARALAEAPTFAELTPGQKDACSHRGLALRALVAAMGG